MGNKPLICALCKEEISDISVANKMPYGDGYCCIECYINKGVMSEVILEEIKKEELKKKYGEGATSEKRVFGKKSE